jgi:hypothetical protein
MASMNLEYSADRRKKLSWDVSWTQGGFYDGSKMTFNGGINYRLQPLGNLGLKAQYNRLLFDAPYKSGELWLINSKIELNFSRNLFWTTFFQYNTQSKNFNINSRIQWRFKPMSDVFLVYTDNYLPESFQKVNRALVFKINYWLNL